MSVEMEAIHMRITDMDKKVGEVKALIAMREVQTESMEKKIDKLEAGMEQLLELANKGRGGFWMGMMVVSAISALIGFITNHALK